MRTLETMETTMQSPTEIDPSAIPAAELRNLATTLLEAASRFFENPGNERRFQEWLRRREESKKQTA